MTPLPQVPQLTNVPKIVGAWLSDVVDATHKQAAALLAVLAATNVVSVGGHENAYALLAYAAASYVAEKLFGKS